MKETTIGEYKLSLESTISSDFETADISSSAVGEMWTKDVEGKLQSYTIYLCVISQQQITEEELKQARRDIKSEIYDKRSTSAIPGVDLVRNLGNQPHIIYLGITDEVLPNTRDYVHNQKGVAEWKKYLQEFFVVDVENEEIVQRSGRNQMQSKASDMVEYFEQAF